MADTRKIGDITVNDGGGLFDSEGLCNTLVNDINNLVKQAVSGNYLLFCDTVVQMTQKVVELKKGIKADLDSKNRVIEQLKEINTNLERGAEHGTN